MYIYILHSAWTGWVGALYHHDWSFLAPALTMGPSLWMEEILQHQKDGWNPINNGISSIYELVQDFAGPSTVVVGFNLYWVKSSH
jgi:hypothetical protein